MDDVVSGWERWALALSAGHSPATGKLLSVEDLDSRHGPADRPAASLRARPRQSGGDQEHPAEVERQRLAPGARGDLAAKLLEERLA